MTLTKEIEMLCKKVVSSKVNAVQIILINKYKEPQTFLRLQADDHHNGIQGYLTTLYFLYYLHCKRSPFFV
jgi:hypothetical protein